MSKINDKRANKGSSPPALHDFELRSLGDYFRMIREKWFLGLCCAALVSAGIGYFLMSRPPVYEAEGALLVEREGERVVDMKQVFDTGLDGQMWRALLENHITQLSSRRFRDYVIESFSQEERDRVIAPYRSEDDSEPVPSVASALGGVEVENLPNSFVLRVRSRHRDPEVAAMIADRYVDRYIEFVRERNRTGNQAAIEFLTERAEEMRQKVDDAERALQEYRQKHNLTSVEEDQNLMAQRLASINESLTDARIDRLELESRLRQVERIQENAGNLMELREVSSLGFTESLVNELGRLRQEREVLSERYLERHPRMIANNTEIAALEKRIRENVQLAVADLKARLENARERESDLLAELREAEKESLEVDRLKIAYAAMERNVSGARTTHGHIVDQLNQISVTSQLNSSNLRVVDRAAVPSVPAEPDLMKVLLLAGLLGGFFFVGTPIGLSVLDRRLKAASDVETVLDQRLVGEITTVHRVKEKERPHVVEKDLNDAVAESFRGLFSQLQMNAESEERKALMVTSTLPGEGKSFLISNLGYCFAAHGKRTLIIDFDLRRPTLHRHYNLHNDAGVLRWLSEGAHFSGDLLSDEALGIREVAPNLSLLRAGGHTKKATEAINMPAVHDLLEALKQDFDLLMIDTPPVGVFPDALVLAKQADDALYVVRFGKVDRQQVRGFVARLEETQAGLLGVVMNGMPRARRYSHYYSGYGYGNYKYAKYYAEQR